MALSKEQLDLLRSKGITEKAIAKIVDTDTRFDLLLEEHFKGSYRGQRTIPVFGTDELFTYEELTAEVERLMHLRVKWFNYPPSKVNLHFGGQGEEELQKNFSKRFVKALTEDDLEWYLKAHDQDYSGTGFSINELLGLSVAKIEELTDSERIPDGQFKRWVQQHGFPALKKAIVEKDGQEIRSILANNEPESTAKAEEAAPPKKAKRRTLAERENLVPRIEEAYDELYLGEAKYSTRRVFELLSERSEELFGEYMTKGAIRGLYERRKGK